jgi:hypothetical protein
MTDGMTITSTAVDSGMTGGVMITVTAIAGIMMIITATHGVVVVVIREDL